MFLRVEPFSDTSIKSEKSDKNKLIRLFSYQVFTCINSVIGTALMITVILFNIYNRNILGDFFKKLSQTLVIYIYSLIMLIGFFLTFLSVFLFRLKILVVGGIFCIVGFSFWLVITALTFLPTHAFRYICSDNRCPETHWLIDTRWRDYGIACPFRSDELEEISENEDNIVDIENLTSQYAGCEYNKLSLIIFSGLSALFWSIFMLFSFFLFYKLRKQISHHKI